MPLQDWGHSVVCLEFSSNILLDGWCLWMGCWLPNTVPKHDPETLSTSTRKQGAEGRRGFAWFICGAGGGGPVDATPSSFFRQRRAHNPRQKRFLGLNCLGPLPQSSMCLGAAGGTAVG